MPMINVRAAPGRVARVSAQGRYLREDVYSPVRVTPYISRRIASGDMQVEEPKPAPKKSRPPVVADPPPPGDGQPS